VVHPPSFRFRIVTLVLGVAIVPLVLIGLTLTRGAAESGEELLSARLSQATDEIADVLVRRWVPLRSHLLDVAESSELADAITEGATADLRRQLLKLDPRIRVAVIQSETDSAIFRFDRSSLTPAEGGVPPASRPLLRLAFEATGPGIQAPVTLEFGVEAEILLPREFLPSSAAGMLVSLNDSDTGAPLLPFSLDPAVLVRNRFDWGGEEWLATRRSFQDPPVELVVAAPLTPYVAPFQQSARTGAFLLAGVALGALALAFVLTSRMTRSLRLLVLGADAVSEGDLSHRIEDTRQDEIGRVARAFNTMTDSLQRTLRETAGRESLAAVGEFAASLAHEVRNPITAIKIDLQALEERVPDDPMLREPLERALHEIKRLDATVGDALAMVRMGNGDQVLDLRVPLAAAVRSASPRFAQGESTLDVLVSDESLLVSGDAAALEQLFLNVLLNAAEALPAGGKAQVHAASGRETVAVVVEDDGPGISDEIHDRVFDPLFSTKSAGTGLGLTVSRRIVDAHRGGLTITTGDDGGARVRICFPRHSDPARASTQSL